MFKRKFKTVTAISLTLILAAGSVSTSVQAAYGQQNQASVGQMSDIQLANNLLKRNPRLASEMQRDEMEFKRKLQNTPVMQRDKLIADFNKRRRENIQRFAKEERKYQEYQSLKNRKSYKSMPGGGEIEGIKEARRLALQCGPKENAGYSNYFGPAAFYQDEYPMIGKEIADIEAIPILRYKMLAKLDGKLRQFISDKQLTFRGQNYNKDRKNIHSGIQEEGGQKSYVDTIYKIATQKNKDRSNKLSETMYMNINKHLQKVYSSKTKYVKVQDRGEGGTTTRTKKVTVDLTGRDILSECRYFWANNNTVKYEPSRDENRYSTRSYKIVNGRIGIQPDFKLAEPVKPKGKPIAMQDLNKGKYKNKLDKQQVTARNKKYQDRLGSKLKDRTADEIVQKNVGTINDAYGNRSVNDYRSNEYKDTSKSYEEYRNKREKQKGLSFEDLYQ